MSEQTETLTDAAIRLLQTPRIADKAGRDCVMQRYDWDANLQRIARLLETGDIEPDL